MDELMEQISRVEEGSGNRNDGARSIHVCARFWSLACVFTFRCVLGLGTIVLGRIPCYKNWLSNQHITSVMVENHPEIQI